jgi:ribosomal protein S25
MKHKKITEEFILNKCKTVGFAMHKYKIGHDYIRKICRKLKKSEKIKKLTENNTQVIYINKNA